MKLTNKMVDNYFYLNKDDFDGHINISIISKDRMCLENIMDKVVFELGNEYELLGFPIMLNNNTIERKIYFKRKALQ